MSQRSMQHVNAGSEVQPTTAEGRWTRYVGWAGLLSAMWIVTVVVTELVAEVPSFADPPAEIRDWFDSDRSDLVVAVSGAGGMVTDLVLFLPFVLGAAYALERAAPENPVLTRLSLFGGAVSAPIIWMAGMFPVALHVGDHQGLSDATLVTIMAAGDYVFLSVLNMSLALWIGAGGLAVLRSGRFPHWIGWVGVGGGTVLVVGGLWFLDGDPDGALAGVGILGFVAMVTWMVGLAISMIRHGDAASR